MRRAMVTGINQTAIDISLHNARQLNCRFMELSAHSDARTGDGGPDYTNHSWWQGQIVSLDGEPGYLSLKDIGYGDVKGFGGANCRHNWHLFWPGISTPAYTPKRWRSTTPRKFPGRASFSPKSRPGRNSGRWSGRSAARNGNALWPRNGAYPARKALQRPAWPALGHG